MHVDYGFYAETYGGGNVPESAWQRLEMKAVSRLEHYTFGRMPNDWAGTEWENKAKCAVCEMAEIMYADGKRDGKTSESTDGYSVSYDTKDSVSGQLYGVAYVYLGSTGLMDFGVDEA